MLMLVHLQHYGLLKSYSYHFHEDLGSFAAFKGFFKKLIFQLYLPFAGHEFAAGKFAVSHLPFAVCRRQIVMSSRK